MFVQCLVCRGSTRTVRVSVKLSQIGSQNYGTLKTAFDPFSSHLLSPIL